MTNVALAQTPSGGCKTAHTVRFLRKADLPADVLKLIAHVTRMADKGEPFQLTDVIIAGGPPSQKFISARQTDCVLSLYYQQGGIAPSDRQVTFVNTGNTWAIRPDSDYPYGRSPP